MIYFRDQIKKTFLFFVYVHLKTIIQNKKIVKNYFNTNNRYNALLSYIINPFTHKTSLAHTNYYEVKTIARILNEIGYNVDIIQYEFNGKLDLRHYDLICGFGDIFKKYFENSIKNKTIKTFYYGAGMHVCHQNNASLNRVKDVYNKKGIWLGQSSRFVEKTWTHQTSLVDGIVALGNEVCADSYKKHFNGKVLSVLAPFYMIQDAQQIISTRKQDANKHFLWFGSSGLIHKGLDLLLDYFKQHSELYLHVCGPIEREKDFTEVYQDELFNTENIKVHGFVDIKSEKFRNILRSCNYVIYPSCSEGGSPSVLTVIGNGGLLPIITKESSISTGFEIWIPEFSYSGIDIAVNKVLEMTQNEVLEYQQKSLEYVLTNNSLEKYYTTLKKSIIEIIGK